MLPDNTEEAAINYNGADPSATPPAGPGGRQPEARAVVVIVLAVVALLAAAVLFVHTGQPHPPGAGSPSNVAPATGPQTYSLNEFTIKGATVLQASSVSLTARNTGLVAHQLAVLKTDLAASKLPLRGGQVVEDAPGIQVVSPGTDINPGDSQERTVDLSTPGNYLFICNIVGHFAAGQWLAVTVK